jgi:hypothetical protein
MDPAQLKKALDAIEAGDSAAALEILKALIASAASGGASDAMAEEPADAMAAGDAAATPPDPAAIAASRELMRVTATATPGEAVIALGKMYAEVQTLAADRAALDLSARQGLVAELVVAGAETPATAWADADKRTPKARFMSEPIEELRERVALIKASRPKAGGYQPPAVEDGKTFKTSRGEIVLSSREIKNCESQGADVNAYAENKAIRAAARNRT